MNVKLKFKTFESPSSKLKFKSHPMVKLVSVHMKALQCFEEAIKHNPSDLDIYITIEVEVCITVFASEFIRV